MANDDLPSSLHAAELDRGGPMTEAGAIQDGNEADDALLYGVMYPRGSRAEREFRTVLTLSRTVRLWTQSVERLLRDRTGQTRTRWETLFAIRFAPQPRRATDLARQMGVQWPALLRNLEGLERDGLIIRQPDPEDSRARLIELTEAGHAVIAEVRATVDPARAALLDNMADAELDAINTLVTRIRGRLEQQQRLR
ncbi:MarR family transcriptional regulator [Altererythrobacter xixiisoli]|uniref:MarR family transcriptional regulator n=1 Tax=Croceibacterium xixiisoli TaxID=1476466 RepID=A0A6I4TX32_9SPHN|nr:MarR family transcriptional regulator [Croceibacterium xixiisoli]MXO98883.1 MarR family transcriptional regulator [Croceibacterium xixiisoli]